jgi:TolB-like protein/DNA-binding winged helix-turn-helix (wHTH) protein/Flp pilus assembly protein TadD
MGAGDLATGRVRFGLFMADLKARQLFRKNSRVKIQNQVFQVLACLIENAGQVVTREELQKTIWPGDTFVDFDEGLNASIRKLRAALGDSADNPRFVETLPRVGYRFIAPVAPVSDEAEELPAAQTPSGQSAPSSDDAPAAPPRYARPRRILAAIAAVALLGVTLAAYLAWRFRRAPGTTPPEAINSIAVLPFEDLSGDPSQEYFSDGLTDELITDLAQLTKRRVISRTSVMQYKGTKETAPEIARQLNVDALVEGTVERSGGRVRVRTRLVRARTDRQIWASSYDSELNDVLTLQGEIAGEIADEISVALGGQPRPGARHPFRHAANFAAYDEYLKGLYFWNKRDPDGFRQAIVCFKKAIDDDPNYAAAYAGLADSYAMMSSYLLVPPSEFMPKARAAALKAIEIDDSLAEAHTSLAIVDENYDWDLKLAEKEYRRAIELNPSYSTAHQWYAECLAFEGRFDEALAESARALQLDPLSLIVAADNGAALYFARRNQLAIQRFRTVLDIHPGFPRAQLIIGAYVEEGRFKEALDENKLWQRDDGGQPWTWAWEAYVYARAGERHEAARALEDLKRRLRRDPAQTAPLMAFVYAGMNDREHALFWLNKAYSEHSNTLLSLKVDPAYDFVRDDPRFQDLLRKVGLAP